MEASDGRVKEASNKKDAEEFDIRKTSGKGDQKVSDKNDKVGYDKRDTGASGQIDEKASEKTDTKASDKRDRKTSGKLVTEAFGITGKITSVEIGMLVSDKRATKEEAETVNNKEKTFCKPCQIEFKETSANGICQECEEYMCSDCFSCHRKAKQCRSHIFIEGTSPELMKSIQENPEKCRRHNNEGIKFYCREHNAVACCDCIIFMHKTCATEYISELSENIEHSEEMSKMKGKLKELNCSTITTDEQVRANLNRCTDMKNALLNEIKTFRNKINEHLDKGEAEIISKVNSFIDTNDDALTKLKNNCEQILSEIGDMEQKLDLQGDQLFIYFVNFFNKIPLLEKQLRCIQSENKLDIIKFFPGREIREFVETRRELGSCSKLCFRERTPSAVSESIELEDLLTSSYQKKNKLDGIWKYPLNRRKYFD